ncbi:Protein ILYS-2 [Aphelenchoides avenae]|nr:Protein ILYS-2 [Aphelenchus avenae]
MSLPRCRILVAVAGLVIMSWACIDDVGDNTIGLPVRPKCIKCICKQESGCNNTGCHMDVGSLSCGYFQIKYNYFLDCGTPGWIKKQETTDVAWKRCASDYECSVLCLKAYVKRYKKLCPQTMPCEQMARLHNGGPHGCKKSATIPYWKKIQTCLHRPRTSSDSVFE